MTTTLASFASRTTSRCGSLRISCSGSATRTTSRSKLAKTWCVAAAHTSSPSRKHSETTPTPPELHLSAPHTTAPRANRLPLHRMPAPRLDRDSPRAFWPSTASCYLQRTGGQAAPQPRHRRRHADSGHRPNLGAAGPRAEQVAGRRVRGVWCDHTQRAPPRWWLLSSLQQL